MQKGKILPEYHHTDVFKNFINGSLNFYFLS